MFMGVELNSRKWKSLSCLKNSDTEGSNQNRTEAAAEAEAATFYALYSVSIKVCLFLLKLIVMI